MPMIGHQAFIWSRVRAANTVSPRGYPVCEQADKRICHALIDENIPVGSTVLYTDEANSYPGCHPTHGTVCHSAGEWARDDDGDGIREVHCNTCEGAGTALGTYLRVFRGVHKAYLHLYVATYEALLNTKQLTAALIRRMCFADPLRTLATHEPGFYLADMEAQVNS
jgi:hypothetical protein